MLLTKLFQLQLLKKLQSVMLFQWPKYISDDKKILTKRIMSINVQCNFDFKEWFNFDF